jgi:hypothetical protein
VFLLYNSNLGGSEDAYDTSDVSLLYKTNPGGSGMHMTPQKCIYFITSISAIACGLNYAGTDIICKILFYIREPMVIVLPRSDTRRINQIFLHMEQVSLPDAILLMQRKPRPGKGQPAFQPTRLDIPAAKRPRQASCPSESGTSSLYIFFPAPYSFSSFCNPTPLVSSMYKVVSDPTAL